MGAKFNQAKECKRPEADALVPPYASVFSTLLSILMERHAGFNKGTNDRNLHIHTIMITVGTSPLIYIDLGNNKPDMTLQHRKHGGEWEDFLVADKVVKSPVDIDKSPSGEYRLLG